MGQFAGNLANLVLAYVLIFGKMVFLKWVIRARYCHRDHWCHPACTGALSFCRHQYQPLTGQTRRIQMIRGCSLCFCVMDSFWSTILLRHRFLTVFILLVGRPGVADWLQTILPSASKMLAFLPMVGMSIATATLVGEYVGQGRPEIAQKSVYSAFEACISLYCDSGGGLFPSPELSAGDVQT